MKKVVVFGGSGFLGSYVVEELIARGYETFIADKIKPKENFGAKFLQCDILDIDSIKKVLSNIDIVYNFAAFADIDKASKAPIETINLNVVGNLNILESCKNAGVQHFVYASSTYALSNKGSFYGISKYTSEKLTEEYQKKYGLDFTVIRYGSLYGERANQENFIFNLLVSAVEDKQIIVDGKGDELREYIHAEDAAKLSVDILEDRKFLNEHIILTGTEQLKRVELATMIKEIMDGAIEVKFRDCEHEGHYKITPYVYHPNRGKKLVANPYIDMGQGLLSCISYIKSK